MFHPQNSEGLTPNLENILRLEQKALALIEHTAGCDCLAHAVSKLHVPKKALKAFGEFTSF